MYRGTRTSPGEDWCADVRLQRGTLAEQEQEARQQGITECWETRVRRDQDEKEEE